MYDYVTREFELTPEEQEKARAMYRLLERHRDEQVPGQRGQNLGEQQAFVAFRDGLFGQIRERLGEPGELKGGWNISEDGSKVIVCQVKWVG